MTEKTKQQLSRFLNKVAEKYPSVEEPMLLTDVHVHVSQETGDIMAFDDEGKEITRCVIEEWIDCQTDLQEFYREVEHIMQQLLAKMSLNLGIMKPYSFVLEDESGEHVAELYVVDDSETVIIDDSLLKGWEEDLDDFIENLLKK